MLRYFVFRTLLQEIIIANTLYYDMVWTEYQYEKELTTSEMQEKVHVDEMLKRVAHLEWQDEQRSKWMSGEEPEYIVPEDCPF
tara:strand:+ start:324 stop:572 length:249 start_codon:yes stop_codon:yes gene_type:complete